MDWSFRIELRADSLRGGNPLPSVLQVLLQVNQLRPRAGQIYTVLGELYSNALEHGVLGLDSTLKCDGDGFKRYYELRQQRLQTLTEGHVHLELSIKTGPQGGRLRVAISDSGSGFDVARALGLGLGRDQFSGRGLHLVRELSDGFEWRPDGRGLSVEFSWPPEA